MQRRKSEAYCISVAEHESEDFFTSFLLSRLIFRRRQVDTTFIFSFVSHINTMTWPENYFRQSCVGFVYLSLRNHMCKVLTRKQLITLNNIINIFRTMLEYGITPKYIPVAYEIIHKLPTLVAVFLCYLHPQLHSQLPASVTSSISLSLLLEH